jgi:peptide-methionine (S)-S-oxide reductase
MAPNVCDADFRGATAGEQHPRGGPNPTARLAGIHRDPAVLTMRPNQPVALGALGAGILAVSLITAVLLQQSDSATAASLPDPAEDIARAPGPRQTAVLAGGCFWGMEAVFEHVKGVTEVVSGYAGGLPSTAAYEQVSRGATGHAEGIRITYDPSQVSYGQLLKVYFAVAHDPTEVNRQGPDVGSQYRSSIFALDPAQQKVAQAYITQLQKAGAFGKPIATRVELAKGFYPAEPYHQNFVARNPAHPYVVLHDLPKLSQLQAQFPGLYR